MKVTAIACSNIAPIKYWGKRDEKLKLPQNNSISITLDNLQTTTTVEFDPKYKEDKFVINGTEVQANENLKLKNYVDYLRQVGKSKDPVKMHSETNFPMGAGLASSASGFAVLAVAATKALGLNFAPRELSILARRGSGSASRSLFGGFVEWAKGEKSDGSDSYAVQIAPPTHWDIRLLIVISSTREKSVSSTKAMRYTVETSPFYKGWLDSIDKDLEMVRHGILKKDFKLVGETAERNCLKMHALMLATTPSLLYWDQKTLHLIKNIQQWRTEGCDCYFTIDAGPNVVILCTKQHESEIKNRILVLNNVQDVINCSPGPAPSFTERHLFE